MADPRQQAFIRRMWPLAVEYSQRTGIPPEVFVAIGASETNWGKAGSIFGIKGSGTAGSQTYATHEIVNGQRVNVNDQFAVYNNDREAFDHFLGLISSGRYAPAWQQYQRTGDWRGLLNGIVQAGYATDKNWPSMISGLSSHVLASAPSDLAAAAPRTGTTPQGNRPMESNPLLDAIAQRVTKNPQATWAQLSGDDLFKATLIANAAGIDLPKTTTQGPPDQRQAYNATTGQIEYQQYDPATGQWKWTGTVASRPPTAPEAARPQGAVTAQQIFSAGGQLVAPGIAVVNGREYRQNPDGTFSVSGSAETSTVKKSPAVLAAEQKLQAANILAGRPSSPTSGTTPQGGTSVPSGGGTGGFATGQQPSTGGGTDLSQLPLSTLMGIADRPGPDQRAASDEMIRRMGGNPDADPGFVLTDDDIRRMGGDPDADPGFRRSPESVGGGTSPTSGFGDVDISPSAGSAQQSSASTRSTYYDSPQEVRGPASALGQPGELVGLFEPTPWAGEGSVGTTRGLDNFQYSIRSAGLVPTGDAAKDIETALGIEATRTSMLADPIYKGDPLAVQRALEANTLGSNVYDRARAVAAEERAARASYSAKPPAINQGTTMAAFRDFLEPERVPAFATGGSVKVDPDDTTVPPQPTSNLLPIGVHESDFEGNPIYPHQPNYEKPKLPGAPRFEDFAPLSMSDLQQLSNYSRAYDQYNKRNNLPNIIPTPWSQPRPRFAMDYGGDFLSGRAATPVDRTAAGAPSAAPAQPGMPQEIMTALRMAGIPGMAGGGSVMAGPSMAPQSLTATEPVVGIGAQSGQPQFVLGEAGPERMDITPLGPPLPPMTDFARLMETMMGQSRKGRPAALKPAGSMLAGAGARGGY